MKRASYRDGVDFIARNDESGAGDGPEEICAYATTVMLASIFGVDPHRTAEDVARLREKLGYKVSRPLVEGRSA